MKLKKLMKVAGAVFFLLSFLSTYSQNLSNGLIGFYPLMGNANDFSVNNNDGVVYGAQLVENRYGDANAAYSFDGVDDYIEIPNSTSLSSPVDELTKNIWICLPEYTPYSTSFYPLISKSDVSSNSFQYHLQVSPLGVMSSCNLWDNTAVNNFAFNANEWYMVTTTLSGNVAKTYINGVLLGYNYVNGNMNSNTAPLMIGRDIAGGDMYFEGKIDDIWIFNRSLTENEISQIYYKADLGVEVSLKVYLEGAVDGSQMSTRLNEQDYLPLIQPFNASPWNYSGVERVEEIPTSDIVDWVLVDFRDAVSAPEAKSSKTLARKAGFLKSDGQIVAMDGVSYLKLAANIENNLFVVVRHRNHLGVLSNQPLVLSGDTYSYDFTLNNQQAYKSNQVVLPYGSSAMIGGDSNGDGMVDFADLMGGWIYFSGNSGYRPGDLNLDGQLDNRDKNDLWLIHQGEKQFIP